MSREEFREIVRGSNIALDKNATKQIFDPDRRIPFRSLARLACPRKTEFWLSERTGEHPRTCKRWLAEHARPPAAALAVVLQEIIRRFLVRI